MRSDMSYDGQKLSWDGHGVYNATSGLPGYQDASEQAVKKAGPIPEGVYYFPLKLAKDARMVAADGTLDHDDGIEHLPRFFNYHANTYENIAWGPDRVRLHATHIDKKAARGRAGFYLHDSTKGYSHGCIEVDPQFFIELRAVATRARSGHRAGPKKLILRVKYPSESATTYGNTTKP